MSGATSIPRYVIDWSEHPINAILSMGHNFIRTPWLGRKVVELTPMTSGQSWWKNDPIEENHPILRLAFRVALCFTLVVPLLAYVADHLFQNRVSFYTPTPLVDSLLQEVITVSEKYIEEHPTTDPEPKKPKESDVEDFRKSIQGLFGEELTAVLFAPPLKLETHLTHPQQAFLIDDKVAFLERFSLIQAIELELNQNQQDIWNNLKAVETLLKEKTSLEISQLALRDQLQSTPARERVLASLNAIALPGSPLKKITDVARNSTRLTFEQVAEEVGELSEEERQQLATQTRSWGSFLRDTASGIASNPEALKLVANVAVHLLRVGN